MYGRMRDGQQQKAARLWCFGWDGLKGLCIGQGVESGRSCFSLLGLRMAHVESFFLGGSRDTLLFCPCVCNFKSFSVSTTIGLCLDSWRCCM